MNRLLWGCLVALERLWRKSSVALSRLQLKGLVQENRSQGKLPAENHSQELAARNHSQRESPAAQSRLESFYSLKPASPSKTASRTLPSRHFVSF